MKKLPVIPKEILFEQYVTKGLPLRKIAKNTGYSTSQIYRYIKKYNIQLNEYQKRYYHSRWTGFGEINNTKFSTIKRNAKERKIHFNLKIEQIWDLFLKQNRRCSLSGIELTFSSAYKKFNGTASLDRIDSFGDYVIDNVQWVHKDLNKMKGKLHDKKFFELCKLVAENKKNLIEDYCI